MGVTHTDTIRNEESRGTYGTPVLRRNAKLVWSEVNDLDRGPYFLSLSPYINSLT